jgi:hypothetical protein
MSARSSPRLLPILFWLVLGCAFFFTSPLLAADGESSGWMLQANAYLQVVADRSRMIQVSLVCVLFGCALLWWKR